MTDTNEVEALAREMEQAWNRHDVKAFVAFFAEDAEFTNVEGKRVDGWQGIEDLHARGFATRYHQSRLTIKSTRVRLLTPDLAAVDVRWQLAGTLDAAGAPSSMRQGLMNWVATREGDGWRIQLSHNTELPSKSTAP